MGEIFQGVSLEDLESGNLSADSIKTEEIVVPQEALGTTTKETTELQQEPEGIDLEVLANLGSEDSSLEEEIKDEGNSEKASEKTGVSPSSQNSMLSSLASALVETGVLSSLSEEEVKEIKDTESLMEAITKQIKTNEFSDLTEEQKEYLEAIRNGVDVETYAQTKANASQYKKLSDEVIESNAPLQKELIRRSFLIKGFDEEKAAKFAELAMKDENALEEAKLAKNSLVAHEEKLIQDKINQEKLVKQAKLDEEVKALEDLKSKITETSDLIPGIKFNSTFKDKAFSSMTTPVKVDKEQGPLNEVMKAYKEDPEYKLKLHALHVATKGFTDFSKLVTTTKSKAVKELKDKLDQTSTQTGLPIHVTSSSSQKDLLSALADLNI